MAAALEQQVSDWRHASGLGDLRILADGEGPLTLLDGRPGATDRTIELNELESLLYRACDDIGELSALKAQTREAGPGGVDLDGAVEATLASLVERRLMVGIGQRYLSLALPGKAL